MQRSGSHLLFNALVGETDHSINHKSSVLSGLEQELANNLPKANSNGYTLQERPKYNYNRFILGHATLSVIPVLLKVCVA
jgi:hypothetical protein